MAGSYVHHSVGSGPPHPDQLKHETDMNFAIFLCNFFSGPFPVGVQNEEYLLMQKSFKLFDGEDKVY